MTILRVRAFSEADVRWKIEQRLAVVISRLAGLREEQDLPDEDLHSIRGMCRETPYTLELLRRGPDGEDDYKQRLGGGLGRTHRALGLRHDDPIGMQTVRLFLQSEAEYPLTGQRALSGSWRS